MKYTIDRFEGSYAVCEDENRKMIDLEIYKLPSGVKEGDVVLFKHGNYEIDMKEIKNRKDRINKMMNNLWK